MHEHLGIVLQRKKEDNFKRTNLKTRTEQIQGRKNKQTDSQPTKQLNTNEQATNKYIPIHKTFQ
jgi:hypothetical protein